MHRGTKSRNSAWSPPVLYSITCKIGLDYYLNVGLRLDTETKQYEVDFVLVLEGVKARYLDGGFSLVL